MYILSEAIEGTRNPNLSHFFFFFQTTTAQKPRGSPHTGCLTVSSLVSGLRSEHSSPPRLTLAGSSINYAEQHTRNTTAVSRIQRTSLEARARDWWLWYMLWGPGGRFLVSDSACTSKLLRVSVPSLAPWRAGSTKRENRKFSKLRISTMCLSFRTPTNNRNRVCDCIHNMIHIVRSTNSSPRRKRVRGNLCTRTSMLDVHPSVHFAARVFFGIMKLDSDYSLAVVAHPHIFCLILHSLRVVLS